MGKLIDTNKKAVDPGHVFMQDYHQAKQKLVGHWKKYLGNTKNPDLKIFKSLKVLVVPLPKLKEKNMDQALELGNIYEDKSGKYYGGEIKVVLKQVCYIVH